MKKCLESFAGASAKRFMTRLPVTPETTFRRFIQRREQIEGDVCGLEAACISVRDVVTQAAESGLARKDLRFFARRKPRRIAPCDQARRNGFGVTLHSEDLPVCFQLKRRKKQSGRVDVGITVHLAEAQKFSLFESGNHPKHSRLLAKTHMVLKPYHIEAVRTLILLAELDDGVGPFAGARIRQTSRLHGAEAQCVTTAPGKLFDRETALKIRDTVLLDMRLIRFGREQRIHKSFILLFGQGAIQVILAAVKGLAIARSAKYD